MPEYTPRAFQPEVYMDPSMWALVYDRKKDP
ncbi:MAG: hypothetical protein H6Q88_1516, partial [Anaeromyxobacteraceae bacterium]|nr:hypothetical protein [Anaeromyxobacteraceae bacterium]